MLHLCPYKIHRMDYSMPSKRTPDIPSPDMPPLDLNTSILITVALFIGALFVLTSHATVSEAAGYVSPVFAITGWRRPPSGRS